MIKVLRRGLVVLSVAFLAFFLACGGASSAPKSGSGNPTTPTPTASPATLSITPASLSGGTVGAGYSAALTATGGTSPYAWSLASGSLPAGLTLSTAGVISGTPKASGSSSFTVTVKDSAASPQSVTGSESIAVAVAVIPIQLTTSSLPGGTVSTAYSATLTASGGTSPYTWSVVSGSLPAGLNLSTAGVISGTPTTTGTSAFSVQVKDSAASPQAATEAESIAVVAASSSCSGTCYYVSPTGSDANSGTSTSSPWQTIAKVQSFQGSLKPGSSVLFESGGVWSEELDITDMNGSSGSPITIGSYGSGALPVIDGGQTASTNGRNYCIDAVSGTFKWITVNGIECRNAYKQGITFQAYGGPGTDGVGIVVQNSYIHHDGAKACTACGSTPASDPGGYLNQLDAQQTTGVQFLNNTVDHCGGHNCVQVHYDIGNAVVSGNVVGTAAPWCNHNCIDVKGGNATVSNNTVNCAGCASTVSAFYTEYNGFSGVAGGSTTTTEHISYIGNVSNLAPEAFHSDSGGSCNTSSCSLQANYFNNTAYAGSNSSFQQFIHSTCTSGTAINIQKNIVDGGQSGWDSACGSKITWNYNDDGGVYATSLGGSAGSNDLKNVNPQYVSASTGNFTPQNTTITTYGAGDSVTSYAYVGAK